MEIPRPERESGASAIDEQDRERWNQIYSDHSHLSLAPDASFVAVYQRLIGPRFALRAPKRALDIAGGVGRNALFLAREGWQVTLNELSDEAAQLAEANAGGEGLQLELCRASALDVLSPESLHSARRHGTRYDLILMLYYLDRALFPLLPLALAPGGMLFIKTRTEEHPRFRAGSHHPEYYLRAGELGASFPGLRVLHSSEQAGMAELLVEQEGAPA